MQKDSPLLNTQQLITRAIAGQQSAREQLYQQHQQALCNWTLAHLPADSAAQSIAEELVQRALTNALQNLDQFSAQTPGAFLVLLRSNLTELLSSIPVAQNNLALSRQLLESIAITQTTPLNQTLPAPALHAYQSGLNQLEAKQRFALILRLEFALSFEQIAQELERSSAADARNLVTQALQLMARHMQPALAQ